MLQAAAEKYPKLEWNFRTFMWLSQISFFLQKFQQPIRAKLEGVHCDRIETYV
jgi:hypothetical protein